MKFQPSKVVATPGAIRVLGDYPSEQASTLFERHIAGDWGDIDDEDKALNDAAVKGGSRILSAYKALNGETVWIITEADRSVTTFLLPSEY